MKPSLPRLTASLSLLATAAAAHAQARVVYVDRSAPAGGDGTSWQLAFRDLRLALESVNTGPIDSDLELRVARGEYRASTTSAPAVSVAFMLSPPPLVSGTSITVSLKGCFLGRASPTPDSRDFVAAQTILTADRLANDTADPASRADNDDTVLALRRPAVGTVNFTIDGATIRGARGSAPDLGGGIDATFNAWGELTIDRCTFEDNWANSRGGGLHVPVFFGRTFVRNSIFRRNRATHGAGLWVRRYMTLDDSVFEDNSALVAGGAAATTYSEIHRCRFQHNSSGGVGGAIVVLANSSLGISTCLLTDNVAASLGGAIYLEESQLWVSYLTLVKNDAQSGGGIFGRGNLYLVASLLASNTASVVGADIAGSSTFRASIERSALGVALNGQAIEGGGTLTTRPGLIFTIAPVFIDPDGPDNDPSTWMDNNWRLSPRSPGVDLGYGGSDLDLDLDGLPRNAPGVLGRTPIRDLGCYESQVALCPADLTAEGAVTVDDLLAFLDALELGTLAADLNNGSNSPDMDGAVTIDDLLYFLARLEGGC